VTIQEYNQSVDLFADQILRFVARCVKDHFFAEDIVQDCYEKLWKNVSSVQSEKVKSYLFTTAYHTMVDRLRKEKRMDVSPEMPYHPESHSRQYSDVAERLEEAVSKLPGIQKTVITLRDYEGYSYQEIGQITGLSESQVKVYIYRARIFLKSFIGTVDVLI
jgi:RNA polymerase sigma factor (sigma-70 family)